ncbi:alanine/glycine:cation symporter family protein [Bacillus sp. RAR_GA_16]|uniref:alanine/glycine:cation symporter family protein n=1 Tax=Bacillus sp. RAR_GA_16 TaxID=2876774 RepID=UPI001CCE68EA|nr:sodium:alanine symporter family protein [Bacillus sp. RAR_GA_16]MCA0172028.1 sodium:alanine symporter family protein [Bacillus sp. RAR_GA_16]
MDAILNAITEFSAFIWGYPMMILLLGGGLFLTIRLGFFQILFFPHALKHTIGKVFKKEKGDGTISPFQAFASALASTAGATNIVGVPVAIAFGGPGAIFWMWVVSIIGMSTKFSEIVLGIKYREEDKNGVYVGGPMYYIRKGLGWKFASSLFAFGLMIEIIPSVMVQTNSISTLSESSFGLPTWLTGIILIVLIAAVVFGGIRRIGAVAEKIVPFMVVTYIAGAIGVMVINIEEFPHVMSLIFIHAFQPISAAGGFAGAGFAAAVRWGLARGLYSNEAGMGTASIAHSAAHTPHPCRQGLWGIFSVFIDTIVLCTVTAFTVLLSGAWKDVKPSNAADMVSDAFSELMGPTWGPIFVSSLLLIFVISTIGVLVFYGEKQAEYLFGFSFSRVMRFVYIISIFVGAIGGLQFVWELVDITLALFVVPNVIAILFLSKEVKELTDDYKYNFLKQAQVKDRGVSS